MVTSCLPHSTPHLLPIPLDVKESVLKKIKSHLHRFYTMSIMVAVDLLGCTGSTEERAALLHKTIQLAAELKSSLGNMFGFAAVMRALELPQVSLNPLTPPYSPSASTQVAVNQVRSDVMFCSCGCRSRGWSRHG